jgi:hypothetical protein
MSSCISRRYKKRFLSACLLATSLYGCGSITYPDVNVDSSKNNKATFQRDAVDCAKAYPSIDSGAHIKQRIDCMNIKGWR